jgi:GTP-binding protein HflX
MRAQNIDTSVKKETAVIIGVVAGREKEERVSEYLNELTFLVDTAGGVTLKRFVQKLPYPDPRTFIGIGKLEEIREFVVENRVDMAVFDDELSPLQVRNLERTLRCKVLDRSNLILDIFALRARTAHARTQVELAQYQYLLPRLAGMWTHLEKQRGGIGLKGPGEKEIETDRRIVRNKIAILKRKLGQIDRQKAAQRSNRGNMVRVALVGYTNVGKSTIMNLLGKTDIFAENKLFATLDTTVRKVIIGNLPFLLSDTVGFIRKLPHHLIESFKSTLDEVRESDLLLHVVDISHPDFEEQIAIVNRTLDEIDVSNKPVIMLFNKIDAYTYLEKEPDDLTPVTRRNYTLDDLKSTWMARNNTPSIFVSAVEKTNIDGLKGMIYEKVKEIYVTRYPYNHFLY